MTESKPEMICRFCLDPASIISKDTCCTGCSILEKSKENMKDKYLVFLGNIYEPSGGWDDFYGWYDSIEECLSAIKKEDGFDKWAHIVDMDWKIIYRFTRDYDFWEYPDGNRI